MSHMNILFSNGGKNMMSFDSRRTMAPFCAMYVGNNPPVYYHFIIDALEEAAAAVADT